MIVGIGVDCEGVSRFHDLKSNLAEKLFTKAEIDYCNKFSNARERLAARFCAKEAVKKAMAPIGRDIMFADIEIVKTHKYPQVLFKEKDLNKKYRVHLSISHSDKMAMAFAMVEQKWKKN